MANARINITMDEELLARADAFAQAHSLTRSGLLSMATAQYIDAVEKMPTAQQSMAEFFSIISDAFRAGTSTAQLEARTAALEEQLAALQ